MAWLRDHGYCNLDRINTKNSGSPVPRFQKKSPNGKQSPPKPTKYLSADLKADLKKISR